MKITSLSVVLFGLAWSCVAMATEEPAYRLVLREGAVELRDYDSITIAEVRIRDSFDDAGNSAFGTLFGYISGRNHAKQKIAMTAPVRQETEADGSFRVGFIAPAAVSLAVAPQPNDGRVQLRTVPPQRMAVLRYSGRWTEKNFLEHERQLLAWMAGRQLTAEGPAVYARYNAPFVPWPMRRNEVMFPVAARTSP